jgi:hypothetical protein
MEACAFPSCPKEIATVVDARCELAFREVLLTTRGDSVRIAFTTYEANTSNSDRRPDAQRDC